MLMGIRLQAHPTANQKLVLSRWMGCARFIWNAKCDEDNYLSSFAKKYLPVGTYAPFDQSYSQYKNDVLSPWLSQCPSQILRNSTVNWFETYKHFLKGECGKPQKKKKSDGGSIHLTKELFRFETCEDGVIRLWIGAIKNNIGYLSIKNHGPYGPPKSIYIKKKNGEYSVSFCYDDGVDDSTLSTQAAHLEYLKGATQEFLDGCTVGVDRGVVRPVQAGADVFDFTPEQKRKKQVKEKALQRYQRRMARQKKGSQRRNKTKNKIGKNHRKIANIRKDFCHKVSHSIVGKKETKVIIFEDLKTKNMTKSPKAKADGSGRWQRNGARAKAGLNKAILDKGWHQLETFTKYKAHRAGKAFFKIPAHFTSQECAGCGHTHPNNRKSQDRFCCDGCGHTDNADYNAAKVIKRRAIKFLLDSGTELSGRGVLLDSGRGAVSKTREAKATRARSNEASKKKRTVVQAA